ncbi:MAG TPA: DUF3617 domain-containing protein [Bryobacteraceae bacterium]|nr:DUF3617 domain-containing protein [Bryobacteraceae bacterium]
MKKILLAVVMICPAAMLAQEVKPIDVKPGLWENITTSQISGLNMPSMPQLTPDQMAKMPPQARAQIEAMQKGAPQTHTMKVCITREQLSKPLFDNGDKSCSYKLASSSSSSQTIHVECVRGNTKTAGDLRLERVDSEHVKGDMLMKTSGDSSTAGSIGQNMTIKLSFNNRFVSSDCGDVKPSGGDK